jgi:predicted HAD superfamily Cof-like phosphohydrolase
MASSSLQALQSLVREFHEAKGLTIGQAPELTDHSEYRWLITDRADKLCAAIERDDFVAAIDGLCDLLYILGGASIAWGIMLSPFFEAVHQANMAKGQYDRRHSVTVTKPDGWQPADHETELQFQKNLVFLPGRLSQHHNPTAVVVTPEGVDVLAIIAREAFAEHAKATLPKPPEGMVKPWDETNEWGREGNRKVVRAVVNALAVMVREQDGKPADSSS